MADIVETADNIGSFKTLLKAIELSGLVETIKSPGPYTVFAPTDDAFAKLPQETLEDTERLKRIVAYHITFGDVRSDDLAQINEAAMVEGSVTAIESTEGKFKINDINILQTDILADNGVIHVIDGILIPAILAGH